MWDRFFDGYRATVDWPDAPFWSEISAAFHDALILLSVRDPDFVVDQRLEDDVPRAGHLLRAGRT